MDNFQQNDIVDLCNLLFVSIIVTGILLCLYWSYFVSLIIKKIQLIQQNCGRDVIERDTLRNQSLYTFHLDEHFEHTVKYYLTLLALCEIGSLIVLFIFAIGIRPFEIAPYYNLILPIVITLILHIIIIGALYFLTPDLKKEYEEYKKVWESIVQQLNILLNNKNSKGDILMKDGLKSAFSPDFTRKLIDRWRSYKHNIEEIDQYTEQIYTDIGNMEEIENKLFDKDEKNNIIGVREDGIRILLGMLRPEKNIYNGNEKCDLDFIHEAYIDWACANKDRFGDDCKTLKNRLIHLPEVGEFNKYSSITNKLFLQKAISWLLLIIVAYLLYHKFYTKEVSQLLALMTFILIATIFMYYIIIVRDRV